MSKTEATSAPAIFARDTRLDVPLSPCVFADRAKACNTADDACALIDETLKTNGFGAGADALAWLLRKSPDAG